MKRMLIIPERKALDASLELAAQYGLGFEYNDFFHPDILDDEAELQCIFDAYAARPAPAYSTAHGAFFDVTPFSCDTKIRDIGALRIGQSIAAARRIGAQAVVFHTNYNPFLNASAYIANWIEQNTLFWAGVLEGNPDICIYLENMFDRTPDILEALSVNLCGYKNYGVCLDYAHAALSETDPEEWARRLGRFARHVHINDNDLISDLHLPWGSGRMDRKAFYRSYDGYLGGAAVLIETSSLAGARDSLRVLQADGFMGA